MYTVHTEYKKLKYTKQSVFESLALQRDFFLITFFFWNFYA